MKPGDFVLDLLRDTDLTGRTILLLRHSKRDSFQGVPEHIRPTVEITPEGVRMATEFGESLSAVAPGRQLFLGHTVARRCQMTAECIAEGYSSPGNVHMVEYHRQIDEPVVNLSQFVALREELGWQALMKQWLLGMIPLTVMQDPRQYSDAHLARLLSFPNMGEGDVFAVIAHDITLFPIVYSVFGMPVTTIEFLNGVLISANENTAEIRFADAACSLRTILPIPNPV